MLKAIQRVTPLLYRPSLLSPSLLILSPSLSSPPPQRTAVTWSFRPRILRHRQPVNEEPIVQEETKVASTAMELIALVPPIEFEGRVAVCDGGGGPTGHPKVYINLDNGKSNACGYCGLRFVQRHHHHHESDQHQHGQQESFTSTPHH